MGGTIHVCARRLVEAQLARTRAASVISLMNREMMIATPDGIAPERHLRLIMNDIEDERAGSIAPDREHVLRLLAFVETWDGELPLLVHCLAGMSRSTAAAFITLCHLNPETPETRIADQLRATSTTANPNRRLVALADKALGRDGRMSDAVMAIGRGETAQEGIPFSLPGRI